MRTDALRAGIDLLPYNSFRDFRTQLRIWNSKFSGAIPLYDINGKARDFTRLSASEVIGCILNWSALPGGSRHHWGTEIDVVDGAVMPPGYQPKLLPEEVAPNGLFLPLHQWLDCHMTEFGFFRPYLRENGGEVLHLVVERFEHLEPMEEIVSQSVYDYQRCKQHITWLVALPQQYAFDVIPAISGSKFQSVESRQHAALRQIPRLPKG
jgi:hypothetical protein